MKVANAINGGGGGGGLQPMGGSVYYQRVRSLRSYTTTIKQNPNNLSRNQKGN